MNRSFILAARIATFIGGFSLVTAVATAQQGAPVTVYFSGHAVGMNSFAPTVISFLMTEAAISSNPAVSPRSRGASATVFPNAGIQAQTPWMDARMEVGRTYTMAVNYGANPAAVISGSPYFTFKPPTGYKVEIVDVIRNSYFNAAPGNYAVRILPDVEETPLRAGTAQHLSNGRVNWGVSLGGLPNGTSAGSLMIVDSGFSADWSTLFTPARLAYSSPASSGVRIYRSPSGVSPPEIAGALRQVYSNEVLADIVTLSSTAYEIRLYAPSAVSGSGFPYTFTGDPFVVYKIEQVGTGQKLQITSKTYSGGYPSSPLRTAVASVERTGTWPSFTWTANDWNTSGQTQLVQDLRTGTGFVTHVDDTHYSYTCSHSLQVPGGAIAISGTTTYQMFPWGEEVVSETTAGRTINYDYYIDPSNQDTYSRLRSTSVAGGGSWEAYEYFGTGGGGMIIHRPYLGLPAAPPSSLTGNTDGVVSTYSYLPDASLHLRLSQVQTTINGTAAGATAFQHYDFFSDRTFEINGIIALRSTRSDSVDGTTQLATVFRYYDGNNDGFFSGRLFSVEQPDKSKSVYVYQFGTWDGTDFAIDTLNPPFGFGPASRICVVHGTTDSSGTAQTSYGGQSLVSTGDTAPDNFYVVTGRSTMEVTIRDATGRVVRTEAQVWDGSAWQLVSYNNLSYDGSGFLTGSTSSNGATFSATYVGEFKTSQTDPSGVTVQSSTSDYDAAGRVTKATRVGYGTIPTVATAFGYDAASRLISQTVGTGGAETIVTTTQYDSLGRVTSQTAPGSGTTSISYDSTGLVRTITLPTGKTRIETMNADGSLASITGTAVVPQYLSYNVVTDGSAPNGSRHVVSRTGASGSARLAEAWTDWIGRPLKQSRPGFSPTGQAAYVEQNFYDSTTGLLTRTSRTGYADTLYEHDQFGVLKRSGLDVTSSSPQVLDPSTNDRIVDRSIVLANNPGDGWWATQTTTGYLINSSSAGTPLSVVKTRLSGFPSGRLAETKVTDIEGNVTTQTVDVDLSAHQVTSTTTTAGVSNSATEIQVNGLATTSIGFDGLTFQTDYDALLRPSHSTDPRKGASSFAYVGGTALVDHVTSPAATTVHYNYDGAGRVVSVQDQAGKFTRTNYDDLGRIYQQWGDAIYPSQHEYSPYGEENKLTTWAGTDAIWTATSWPTTPPAGVAAITQWNYDAASGLLISKSDNSSNTVSYDYNARRQPAARTWARGGSAVTNYSYDANTGELTGTSYVDGTPAVGYTYTRSGEIDTVSDVTGTRTFAYDGSHPWRLDHEQLGAYYGGRWLSPLYEAAGAGAVTGRAAGFQLGTSSTRNSELEQDWHYESATSRLSQILSTYANNSATTRTFTYGYVANSDLLGTLSVTNPGGGASPFSVTRNYESNRDLMTLIQSNWSGAPLAQFDYAYTALGQRDWEKRSGSSYSIDGQKVMTQYSYNDRGELTKALNYLGENPANAGTKMPNLQFEYGYDNAGNRLSANQAGDASKADSFAPDTANLNRLASRDNKLVFASGTAGTGVAVQVKVDGAAAVDADRQGSYWSKALAPANTAHPDPTPVVITGNLSGGVRTEPRVAPIGQVSQAFSYDADGNMLGDGIWDFTWDAENRLTHAATTAAARTVGFPTTDIYYSYDYLNRRTLKRAITGGVETSRGYLYEGWTVIAEYDAAGGSSIGSLKRSYTWGLDLAGSLGVTGGVGGLLQLTAYDAGANYLPAYDARGNVMALYDATSGAAAAIYEYSPFGELLRAGGTYAKLNPIRFSTEFTDDETGLIYYGQRYYAPALGRFIGKDPIAEAGGLNLHGFVGNDPINRFDVLGMGYEDRRLPAFNPFVYTPGTNFSGFIFQHPDDEHLAEKQQISDEEGRVFAENTKTLNVVQQSGIEVAKIAGDGDGVLRKNVAPNSELTLGQKIRIFIGISTAIQPNPVLDIVDKGIAVGQMTESAITGITAAINPVFGVLEGGYENVIGRSLNPDTPQAELGFGQRVFSGISAELNAASAVGVGTLGAKVAAPAVSRILEVGTAESGVLRTQALQQQMTGENILPTVNKAVNSELIHASERAAERGIFASKDAAADALRNLSESITRNGLPPGTILDTAHADRVLVPFGNNGMAVYQIGKNGTAKLKTVLIMH